MATSNLQLSERPAGDLVELADIERQIQKWTTEAVELGRRMEALAIALRSDASRIDFRGDLIILDHKKTAEFQLILDLASVRNLVSNLRLLKARSRQLETLSDHD
jgi:hypothetical protein